MPYLKNQGIIGRPVAGYNLPNHIRFTVGTERENRRIIAAFEEFLGA